MGNPRFDRVAEFVVVPRERIVHCFIHGDATGLQGRPWMEMEEHKWQVAP